MQYVEDTCSDTLFTSVFVDINCTVNHSKRFGSYYVIKLHSYTTLLYHRRDFCHAYGIGPSIPRQHLATPKSCFSYSVRDQIYTRIKEELWSSLTA